MASKSANRKTGLDIDLEQRIRTDLAPLGKVCDIRGTFEETEGGMWFQDVTVAVMVPSWRNAIRVFVCWDPEAGDLVYRNGDGKDITINPAPEKRATSIVLERVGVLNDQVVSNGNRAKWTEETKTSKRHWMVALAVLGFLILAGLTVALGWGPVLVRWAAVVAAVAFAGFGAYVLTRGPDWFNRHHVEHPFVNPDDEVDWKLLKPQDWNGHPVEVFDAVFYTDHERRSFLEELKDHCYQSAVVFEGFPRVTSLCYRDGGTKANRRTPDVQMRIPMVEFTGSTGESVSPTVCYWDGQRIYYNRGDVEVYPA